MFVFTKFQHARPSREKTIRRNRTGNLVYPVSHKLLAQIASEIRFALKGVRLQRKHNIFMSDRGTVGQIQLECDMGVACLRYGAGA